MPRPSTRRSFLQRTAAIPAVLAAGRGRAGPLPESAAPADDASWESVREVFAFRDISPQAPVHVLVIPRKHVAGLDDPTAGEELLGRLMLAARRVADEAGVAGAYRVVNNCGASAGQSVFHIHLHVLGGRSLAWPPG